MKKIFLLPFLMFALPALASGQAMRHEESGSGNVEPEILRLENEWMSALVRRDAEVLERLMADDFLLLGEQWNGKRALAPKRCGSKTA